MTKKPIDPRTVLAEIAGDKRAPAVHRLRAARAMLAGEPRQRRAAAAANAGDALTRRAAELSMESRSERMPSVGTHRGVSIDAFQPEDRIRETVIPAIDEALEADDPGELLAMAGDIQRPAEARLAAAGRYRALAEREAALHGRNCFPDLDMLAASVAGCDSLHWADPRRFCCLLDLWPTDDGAEPDRRPDELVDELVSAQAAARAAERR